METNPYAEEELGKVYDAKLLRRLLTYTAPYRAWLVLSIILLLLITATDLARPYLVKVAIDEHLNALSEPMLAYPAGQAPVSGIPWEGQELVRQRYLQEAPDHLPRYQILSFQGDHYLIDGSINRLADYQVERSSGQWLVTSQGTARPARLLSPAELSQFRATDRPALLRLGLFFLITLVTGFLLNYAQTYMLHFTGQKISYELRRDLFAHLQQMSIAFFDRNPVGRLITRLTNDPEALNEMFTAVLVNLFKDIFLLVGIIIVMLRFDRQLGLLVLTVLPLVILAALVYQRYARDAYRQTRLQLSRLNSTLQEHLSGIQLIQAFQRQTRTYHEFKLVNEAYYRANQREIVNYAIFRPLMDLFFALALALLLWFGGGRVLQGVLELGVLYAMINYTEQFFRPINDMTEKYSVMQSAMTAGERIVHFLDEKSAVQDPHHPQPLPPTPGEITFDGVWFAYQPGEWVLRDISFNVAAGETVALVGATGAGKSSIINLLLRFYDPQQGRVLVNSMDLRQVRQQDLRQMVGVVFQDVFLFARDVAANIRLNRSEISDAEVEAIARAVQADQFVTSLPGGYHQQLEERASTLSSGQRQLLAFARALAFDPPILVLDEATANIDTETENRIQQAMALLSANRTTLIIAHRLATIQHADKIIVLHKGRIREMGTHQQLLALGGIYYRLYQLQQNGE